MRSLYFRKFILIYLSISLVSSLSIYGQNQETDRTIIPVDWDVCKYYPVINAKTSSIKPPTNILQKMARGSENCATFIVDYNGFTPEAQAAFQFAVDIWSNSIESSVPIRVSANFGELDEGVLGGAGPTSFSTISVDGLPSNIAFPIALAEKLAGEELTNFGEETSTDIQATFSSTANFYFGLDGNTPINHVDFVSVVLHELGHGLGILGFGNVDDPDDPTQGLLRVQGFIGIWDNFIENGTPTALTTFEDPSAELLSEITGNNLFSNGPITTAQNGGVKPSTYAPTVYRRGSSYSHWDEGTYPPGHPNSLMTPSIGLGEAIHNPGLVTLGFMEDMGWGICGGTLSVDNFNLSTIKVSPNPFNSSIDILLDAHSSDTFSIDITDLNGRQILKITQKISNGKLTISNLEQLEDALYFIKISNENTGSSIIKKVIKY
ncbi:T9SS type A sorting domain-containing protein [Winogradskyella costae]|uniref:T9SS type A sorting domain-containing protein n=1 Tax=Winogradskyella costae TaxID=2697008 RepID=UPI0015C7D9F3|nr:T9SS type A sorting domain-containing protein [Winogradskyella costae]